MLISNRHSRNWKSNNHGPFHVRLLRFFIGDHQIKPTPKNLPPELLSETFELCLVDSTSPPSTPFTNPYPLCAICTYWRDVAFTTPRLWSTLHVNWGSYPDSFNWFGDGRHYGLYSRKSSFKGGNREWMPQGFDEEVKKWLHRAGKEIMLNLTFDVSRFYIGDEPRKVLEETYRAPIKTLNITGKYAHISKLSNRGSAISFKSQADAEKTTPKLCSNLPDPSNILRVANRDPDETPPRTNCVEDLTLTLLFTGYCPGNSTINLSSFTSLKRLRIFEYTLPMRAFSMIDLILGIPYCQLTDLERKETGLSQNTVRDIMRKATNLERCHFQCINRSLESPDVAFCQEPEILMTNMKSLRLSFHPSRGWGGADNFNDFFKGLRAPRIVDLSLRSIENGLTTDVMNALRIC